MCDKIPLQNPAQILETLQSEQPRMVEFFRLLMLPCSMERDVGPVTADLQDRLQDRCNVGLERITDHQELRRLPPVQFLEKPCDIILNIHNYFLCHNLSGFLHGNANCRPVHLISPAKLRSFALTCKFRKKFSGFRGNCYFCAPKIENCFYGRQAKPHWTTALRLNNMKNLC